MLANTPRWVSLYRPACNPKLSLSQNGYGMYPFCLSEDVHTKLPLESKGEEKSNLGLASSVRSVHLQLVGEVLFSAHYLKKHGSIYHTFGVTISSHVTCVTPDNCIFQTYLEHLTNPGYMSQ